jgi:hypothetical protein
LCAPRQAYQPFPRQHPHEAATPHSGAPRRVRESLRRLPQTLEAIVLHYADNLDAQTVGVKQLVEGAVKSDAEWSEYDKLNNRYFYLG